MSGSEGSAAMDPAAQAAAIVESEAAFRSFTIELFTLFGIGALSTVLRTYARIKKVGLTNLAVDDFLVWLGLFCYATQASLGYSIGSLAQGLANNGMTDEQRARIDVNSKEHELRVLGSQIQVAGWTVYSILIWCFKLSMLFFYVRLTEGLGRAYRMRVWYGFGLVLATFFSTILTISLGCRPFNHYWQVTPNPGNHCQPALSDPIIWSSFAANVSTDIYLILIPLDLLWSSTLKLYQKIASTIVLGTGIFVLVCAILKTVYVLVDPVNGAQLAGQWGTREAFTCVITTNLPMVFPLLRQWLGPLLPSFLRSSRYTSGNTKKYKTPTGFRTIGGSDGKGGPGLGGGGSGSGRTARKTKGSGNPVESNVSFTESEERMMGGGGGGGGGGAAGEVRLQRLSRAGAAAATPPQQGGVMAGVYPPTTRTVTASEREDDVALPPGNNIVVSSEVEVTSDRASHGEQRPQRPHEAW
ncbi:hypothetical protein RB595_000220 [Gaeumannomyces hyphopodioides]